MCVYMSMCMHREGGAHLTKNFFCSPRGLRTLFFLKNILKIIVLLAGTLASGKYRVFLLHHGFSKNITQ
jgi:hypothetical protein